MSEVEELRNRVAELESILYNKKVNAASDRFKEACMEYDEEDPRIHEEFENMRQDQADALLEYDPDTYSEKMFFGQL